MSKIKMPTNSVPGEPLSPICRQPLLTVSPRDRQHKQSCVSFYKDTKRCCESAALNMPANLENSAVATGQEKVSFKTSFQSQRKAMPKNAQITAQLHSSQTLVN